VRSFHEFGYVHGDLKPGNIGVREVPGGVEFCVFDMTTCVRTKKWDQSIDRPRCTFIGTPSFASIATLDKYSMYLMYIHILYKQITY